MYLKLSKWLEKIAFKIKQKALYFELKHYIKKKISYLKPIHETDRRIAKTYTLLQLAHKYKCPIVVPNQICSNYIKDMSRKVFKKDVEIIIPNPRQKGKRFNILLIEEGIPKEKISKILTPMTDVLVGYILPAFIEEQFKREYECSWIKQ